MIDLVSGPASLQLCPELGAGLAGLWVDAKPVLRPWSKREADGPFALASNLLVPFSNRIANGFTFHGQYHAMLANLEGEACAIHGDGFQKAWTVFEATASRTVLGLDDGAFGPFSYQARHTIMLADTALTLGLDVTNTADIALPFGGGFHPWFPRSSQTRLQFHAPDHLPEGEGHLPSTNKPQAPPSDFDFSTSQPLPKRWINCGFSCWDGFARIDQGAEAVSVSVRSSNLSSAVVYSPKPDCGFFCFEPVSHPVNAHNLADMPGLQVLQPGQSMTMETVLDWSEV